MCPNRKEAAMDGLTRDGKKVFLLFLWPLSFFIFWGTAYYPQYIENYYTGFSKTAARHLSLLSGIAPFSIAEIIVILFIISFTIFFIKGVVGKVIGRKRGNKGLGSYLLNLVLFLGVVYFCFVLIWGLNYNRQSFSEIAGLKVEAVAQQELQELCITLINRASSLRKQIVEDENGVMTIEGGFSKVREQAVNGFEKAAEIYPQLQGTFGKPKPVFFSSKMSYTGISGIYFPFTGEANVNVDIPHSLLPATTCHEMAHQRGFAREDEANYIAWVTCSANDNPEFQYSGTLLALIHSMNALFKYNPEKAIELFYLYDEGVARDLHNLSEYWKKHEGRIEEISSDVNDAYLKSNLQEDGIESYGRMVDLLLAEQKADPDKKIL